MDYAAKNQQFLAWFWDLASDDRDRRVGAADSILAHVSNAVAHQKGLNEEGNMVIDLDYALKRLVRGLSSSRDSARHGFATCLSALISSGAVPLDVVMHMIESSTQLRGKMKGSEERDLVFGKLFAYLAVARSGALAAEPALALEIFQRLLTLHGLKGWLSEVTSEGLLVLLSVMDPAAAETQEALAALEAAALLQGPMEEWSAWQLQLACGLQRYAAGLVHEGGGEAKALRAAAQALLPEPTVVTAELLRGALVPVLTGAAAGFPKVHRVWEMLFACAFDLPAEHAGRLDSLSERKVALLSSIVEFIRTHLLVASKEKRSLAFRLSVRLAALVPIALLPVVANKTALRSMVAARQNKKHALNTQAALAIRDLVSSVLPLQEAGTSLNVLEAAHAGESSNEARLALASCLVEHGSANFDAITGIPAVGTLLVGLDSTSVLRHVRALIRLVGASCGFNAEAAQAPEEKDTDEEQWRAAERSPVASALAALEALTSLAKNRRLSCRGPVCSIVVTVLVKLACFADGELPGAAFTQAPARKSTAKKAAAGEHAAQARETFVASVAGEAQPLLDALGAICGGRDASYAAEVSTAASGKLLTLLSEIGGLSQTQLDAPPGAGKDKEAEEAEEGGASMLSQALATAAFLAGCGVPAKTSNAGNAMEVEGSTDVLAAFQEAYGAINEVCAASSTAPLSSALCGLLGHATFQLLAANSDLGQTVLDLAAVAPTLMASLDSKDASEEELEEPLGTLLDACFDLLAQDSSAVRGEQLSLKGVAGAVKRVWTVAGKDLPVGLGLLENIVSAVVGDDNDDEEDDHAHDNEDGHDHENEAEASDGSESEEEVEAQGEVEGEVEEDELLGEESALNLLASEQSDDDDELAHLKGMLPVTEHGAEADAALVHMLEMRKKHRKAGLLDAKRKQMLVRSRAVDILEAVLARIEIPELLVPLLPPLLTCARKVQTGLTSSLAEGRVFESRLRSVIDQRICHKKFPLSHYGDAETEEGIQEMVQGLCATVKTDMANASAPLRQLAQRVLMCLTRSISLGDCAGAKVTIGETHRELLVEYFSRKKARVGAALFDETVLRFPDFAVEHYVLECAVGAASAISPFLRAEACRMLLAVTRRFGAFADPARETMAAAVPTALKALTACVAVTISDGDASVSAGNAKRLKPALQCIRELCALPICVGKVKELQALSAASAKNAKGKKTTKAVAVVEVLAELERCLRAAGERLPTLLPLVQQSLTAIAAVGGGEVAVQPAPVKEKVAGKKRGATDSLEAMEQKLLNDSNSAAAMSEEAEKKAERKASATAWHGEETDGKKKSKKSKK